MNPLFVGNLGITPPILRAQQVIAQGGEVLVAFDADNAREEMAWRVAAAVSRVMRAEQGVMQKEGQTDDLRSVGDHRQAFKTLWKWHRLAAVKGHSAAINHTDRVRRVVETEM